MGMQNFIKIYQKGQGIGPVSLFSDFEPRQNLDLSQIPFDNFIGYILSISMCKQNFITIFFTVLEIRPFSLFQNLELGKASTDEKCHFTISWARSCLYQYLRKSLSKYSTQFKRSLSLNFITIFFTVLEIGPFSLFQNLALGKASTDDKCHFVIPWDRSFQYQCVCKSLSKYSKRFKSLISLFSEFEPRLNLYHSQMPFDYLFGYIMSISMCMQNFIIIFHSVQEIGPFSLFQNLKLGKASTDEKCHFAISWARSC